MKVIISHDVDHLYITDHLLKDLVVEKMYIRNILLFLRKKISFRNLLHCFTLIFCNRMNRIDEVMEYDRNHNIPSVFFFGMDNVFGMSYSRKKAAPVIQKVLENGFDAGVHGVDYENQHRIDYEKSKFFEISGMKSFGIRNHYVRFNDDTFNKQNKAGYLFDTTYFNKNKIDLRAPFKIGNMWEFPLHIMDGYVCKPGNLKEGLNKTISIINEAKDLGLPYCTILFHDYQFDKRYYPDMITWYERTVEYCEENKLEFISYRDAIKELNDQFNMVD